MRRGLRQFEGAEWAERERDRRVFVIPSRTDPMGSDEMRAREAAAQDHADDFMAEKVLFSDWQPIRRNDATPIREAAE